MTIYTAGNIGEGQFVVSHNLRVQGRPMWAFVEVEEMESTSLFVIKLSVDLVDDEHSEPVVVEFVEGFNPLDEQCTEVCASFDFLRESGEDALKILIAIWLAKNARVVIDRKEVFIEAGGFSAVVGTPPKLKEMLGSTPTPSSA